MKKKIINSIILNDKFPELEVNIERLKEGNDDLMIDGKKIAFGVYLTKMCDELICINVNGRDCK